MKKNVFLIFILFCLVTSSCSFEKLVANKMSDALGSNASAVFTGDEDPELIGDAFPVILKMYELLIQMSPETRELYLTAGV